MVSLVTQLPSDPCPLPTSPWTRPQPPPPLQRVAARNLREAGATPCRVPGTRGAAGEGFAHSTLVEWQNNEHTQAPHCLPAPGWTPGPAAHTGLASSPFPALPPTIPSCETLPARALLSGCPHASASDSCESYHAVLLSHAWGSLVPHPPPPARRSCLSTRLSAFTSEPLGRAGPHPALSEPTASPSLTQGTALTGWPCPLWSRTCLGAQ